MPVYPGPWAGVAAAVPGYSTPPPEVVYPGAWSGVNATVPDVVTANWWKRKGGRREPLKVRERLSPEQIRRRLVPGTYEPDALTTGPHTPGRMVEILGNVTLDKPGQSLVDKIVRGRVFVTAPGCKIDNCRITGPTQGFASGALVTATNAQVVDLLIQDTELAPHNPNDKINCFEGHHATFRRVNGHHGVDIIGVIGQLADTRAEIRLEAPWLHDMVMFNTATQPTDNITHNDLIQWHGLLGLYILGARLEAFCDPAYGVVLEPPVRDEAGKLVSGNPNFPFQTGFSVVMASPARKLMGDFELRRSWLDGGAVGLNFGGPTLELFPDGGIVDEVWFGDGFRHGPDFGILTKAARPMTISRTYRWNKSDPFDTSTPINPRKNG